MNRYFAALALVFALFSCQKDSVNELAPSTEEIEEVIGYPDVDEQLWVYFQRFEEEAANRGIFIDLRGSEVSGEVESLGEDGVAGQCTYNSHLPNHVTIDQGFWEESSDLYREFVVFHELGHCELARDHREGQNSNGTCISLMRSGLENCRDNYNPVTRSAYLDELFDSRFFDEI